MKDYSRMFQNKPAAKEKKLDYSSMFATKPKAQATPAVVRSAFSNSSEIMEWRRDLSEKVKEHVDLIEALVRNDSDIVADVQEKLHKMAKAVLDYQEKMSTKSVFSFFRREAEVDMKVYVNQVISEVEVELRSFKRPNPFKIVEVEKMLSQATYLAEQLAKAGSDLEKRKPACTDDLEVDAINRRCHTLYTQQQLVALGVEQVKKLAMDIKTRPNQVDDLINATVPMYRMLCLDVLNGTKQSTELRNAL